MNELSRDDFLWVLGSLCNLHRRPFDAKLLLSQFAPPYSFAKLVEAGAGLGLQIDPQTGLAGSLEALPVPFVAIGSPANRSASGEAQQPPALNQTNDAAAHATLALVAKVSEGRVLFFASGEQSAKALGETEFSAVYSGGVLLCHAVVPAVPDEDAPKGAPAFGFRWFVPELLKHRKVWRDVLLASLVMQLIALAVPICTQVIIDKVVVHQTVSTLVVIAAALLIFMVFSGGLTWIRQYLVVHTGNRVDAVLGAAVFERLLKLPVRYFEQRPTGVVAARMHAVETIREFLSGAAVILVLDLPFLLIFIAIMLYYSWVLTLIALGVIGLISLMSLAVAPLFQTRLNEQFLLGARNQAFLTEFVAGAETVKSLQMEPVLRDRYSNYLSEYLQAGFRTKLLANHYNTAAGTLEQFMSLGILCFGAWQVMTRPDFTVGMLVAFQMFAGRVSQPMLRLVGLWQQFQQAQISVRRLGDIMDAPEEPYSVVPQTRGMGAGRIDVEGISFRYGETLPWLYEDLSLGISPGECVALMGPSGSGKSTLAKLLQGFYLPGVGKIMIDGKDHRFLSANELRAVFGVVPQETILFSGTVYENLLLANPQATFELVVEACKFAEIHEVIEKLPKGYQTELGERGVGLSGGQRQRIAIARALLKQPRVLIFDEATSNLDPETAAQFARTVNSLKGRVSMLFIAHHLPDSLKVDRVVKLGRAGARDDSVPATAP